MARYYAKKVVIDNIKFDSEMEADYYVLLKERQNKGEIDDLQCHPSYELQPEFELKGVEHKAITYEPDFQYFDYTDMQEHYIDVKGVITDDFALKYKMFEYVEHKHLEILKYSKTTGWVEYKDYKRIMREKKSAVVAEKNKYKTLYEMRCKLDELLKIEQPTKRQLNQIARLKGLLNEN